VPAKSIVITFDDGNMDGYTNAFPILQQLGMVATFNVVASGGGDRMTWSDMATMARAGMEIANHTLNHRNVSYRTGSSLWLQIGVADQRIRTNLAALGVFTGVTTFAYPVGKVGPAAVALLASLHYTLAFTEVEGWVRIGATDPLRAPRVRVGPSLSAAGLLALLP
jgi:peptidoglycan/xylan/chitin deacetylase (PgdA/CDA1 family)